MIDVWTLKCNECQSQIDIFTGLQPGNDVWVYHHEDNVGRRMTRWIFLSASLNNGAVTDSVVNEFSYHIHYVRSPEE